MRCGATPPRSTISLLLRGRLLGGGFLALLRRGRFLRCHNDNLSPAIAGVGADTYLTDSFHGCNYILGWQVEKPQLGGYATVSSPSKGGGGRRGIQAGT